MREKDGGGDGETGRRGDGETRGLLVFLGALLHELEHLVELCGEEVQRGHDPAVGAEACHPREQQRPSRET